jgi:hypothetical protein
MRNNLTIYDKVASDLGNRPRLKLLHCLWVTVTLIYVALAGVVSRLFI